ncbi:TAP-like domain-containing protein [Trichoderma barbatum]
MRTESLTILGWSALAAAQFNWSSIKPSKELIYVDCLEEYKCARLLAPLDPKNESDTREVALAILKLPAKVPIDDETFGGTIFTNPGGPGSSGTDFVTSIGHHLQETFDRPGKKHYEILSWDPRGVGETTPRAQCFPGKEAALSNFYNEQRGTTGLSQLGLIPYNYGLNEAFNQQCEKANSGILGYATTTNVVADMLVMLDAVEDERKAALNRRGIERATNSPARLQYVGFSYGTILGNYFASMHPGRVGRMVLDGVMDVEDYARGPGFTTNLEDADAITNEFFRTCSEVGPKLCPLVKEGESSESLEKRFWDAVDDLKKRPRGVINPDTGSATAITDVDMRFAFTPSNYNPISAWKKTGGMYAEALAGNFTGLLGTLTRIGQIPNPSWACQASDDTDGLYAYMCTDGEDVTDKDFSYWADYAEKLSKQSKIRGDTWAALRFTCSSWKFRSDNKFNGPWTTPAAIPNGTDDTPLAPILFISNRLDPVTPVSSARRMREMHTGAALVVQESMGHCALSSASSNCTDKIVSEYFDTGKVPKDKETVCEANCGPWDDVCVIRKTPTTGKKRVVKEQDHSVWSWKSPLGIM